MNFYQWMCEYDQAAHPSHASGLPTKALGHSLGLFHTSLVEAGLEHEGPEKSPHLTAQPEDINTTHLSHFIVAFLPFNASTEKNEINPILFDVYAFFKWLDKKNVVHGMTGVAIDTLMKDLCATQERCLELSHLLDHESGQVLQEIPEIVDTLSDLFLVKKIEANLIHLQGTAKDQTVSLRLNPAIMQLVKLNDCIDLVLGDTSEKWVVLEAGKVFPDA